MTPEYSPNENDGPKFPLQNSLKGIPKYSIRHEMTSGQAPRNLLRHPLSAHWSASIDFLTEGSPGRSLSANAPTEVPTVPTKALGRARGTVCSGGVLG